MLQFQIPRAHPHSLVDIQSHSRSLWRCLRSCFLSPIRSIRSWYQLRTKVHSAEKEHLRILYARVKTPGHSLGKLRVFPLTYAYSLLPVENYPQGWPQLAALQNSNDNFAIFRRFGLVHCRVLLHLQAEIELLEHKLSDLDQADAKDGSSTSWRLRTAEYKENWDPAQKDILKQLQDKLQVYGENHPFQDRSLRHDATAHC
jgi:hypothetical protein